jgi:UDP-2,3-diacylglucosamine hydrolase
LMLAFVKEFVMSGMQVLDQTLYIKPLLAQEGVCTARQPSDAEWQDIEYGFAMAKEIGRLDIGQTVVVKNKAVLAVEAIEGTDAAIRRGGQLAQGGAIVAKVAKPQQDVRFDMPGIGANTLQSMIDAGAKVLVVEAGKTLLIDRAKVIRMADKHGIAIVSINK